MTAKNSDEDSLSLRIKKMQDNSNELATAHACLQDFQNLLGGFILGANLSIPLFLVAIALLPEKETANFFAWLATVPLVQPFLISKNSILEGEVKYVAACLAMICFLTSLVDLLMKPEKQATIHKNAVDHYTKAKYELRDLKQTAKRESLEDGETSKRLETIKTTFLNRDGIPAIPEVLYLPLKFWHLTKILISDILSVAFKSLRIVVLCILSGKFLNRFSNCCKKEASEEEKKNQ